MTYVIVEACIGVKDRACVDVCPVDCIYEGEDQLYIHPDECIDCGACEPECPVTAIFPEEDVPPNMTSFVEKNRSGLPFASRPSSCATATDFQHLREESGPGIELPGRDPGAVW
jgi:NAD-dependent dihydropyrimidine dehydrogenase PreA subunit